MKSFSFFLSAFLIFNAAAASARDGSGPATYVLDRAEALRGPGVSARKQVDRATFRRLDAVYAVDKDNVYEFFQTNPYVGYVRMPGRNPVDFSAAHGSMDDEEFQRYLGYSAIPGVDKATFELLGGGYARDENHAYYGDKVLSDSPLIHVIVLPYATDGVRIWFDGREIAGADAASFQYLNYYYSKDDKYVYHLGQVVPGLDAATFRVLPGGIKYGSDKNGDYLGGSRVPQKQ